jgi:hypothetical protein
VNICHELSKALADKMSAHLKMTSGKTCIPQKVFESVAALILVLELKTALLRCGNTFFRTATFRQGYQKWRGADE